MKYDRFKRKAMATCPRKGAYHYRQPSRMFWRVLRGMMPFKTKRGAAALARLKAYEGIPEPYDKVKRAVVPEALKVLRLQAQHKFTTLGRLGKERGWRHFDAVKSLEAKRKVASKSFYEAKKKAIAARVAAVKKSASQLASVQANLNLAHV
jgi:large subunit ribosomal protein L13Ae